MDVLIGRDRELAILAEAGRSASSGHRAIVMISGEPGIGKTRLLEELATQIERDGGRTAWGRTWEVGMTPAFWPWTQLLAVLAEPDDPAPALVGLDDRADAASRLARFDAVAAFLIRRAASRPLALLLDDMHAADASSLLLLEYLARQLRSARLLIALTARDGEAPPESEAALARIRRDAKRIVVGRLDATHVARMVGERASTALIARVHELSEGNPLFVEELVACIAAHGDLDRVGQITGVHAVIRDRVARLPATTASVLAAGALAGREFRGIVIADALGLTAAELDARLAPALKLGVVVRAAPDRYRFSHGLVAESLAEHDDAAGLHARLADALERHEGDHGASAIAHHRLAIAHLDPVGAAAAAEQAARVSLAHLAFEDAASLLDRAIGVLADDAATRKQRGALLCARAEALQHAGDHARARALCDDAARLARDAGDGVLLARIALARGIEFQFGSTDRVLVDMLGEALAAMPPGDSSLRARCLARLAAAEQPAADSRIPIAAARDAIAMARRIGDRRTRLDVLNVAFAAMIEFVPPTELDVLLRELFVLATSPGDRLIALRNRLRHCFITLELANRSGFDAAVLAHAELAEAIGMPRWTWPVKLIAAMIAAFEGRFADADAAAGEAEAIGASDPQGERTFAYHRWATAWLATRPSAALARRVADCYEYARPAMSIVAALDDGDLAAVTAALAAAEPLAEHDDFSATILADAIAACGDAARARRCYEQLAPNAGRLWVSTMTGFTLQDFSDRCLLVLAGVLGRWEAVDTHAGTALGLARKLDAAPWVARIQADWATALDRRGDHARADELWDAARIAAERLGMPGLLARCVAARTGRVAPRSPVAEPARESSDEVTVARDGALWTVRGRGCVAHVRDSRGMQMLARLVGTPGREIHAIELDGEGGVDTGDAGEMLDPSAKAAYRKRLAELTEELEEAEAWRDAERAERARAEVEALARELSRAVGLGGRARKSGAASERARINAQRRLAYAIQQIKTAAPALGEHLAARVRTGTFCVYDP
jgi:hypothetical protein